jgi:hypothetical protein
MERDNELAFRQHLVLRGNPICNIHIVANCYSSGDQVPRGDAGCGRTRFVGFNAGHGICEAPESKDDRGRLRDLNRSSTISSSTYIKGAANIDPKFGSTAQSVCLL